VAVDGFKRKRRIIGTASKASHASVTTDKCFVPSNPIATPTFQRLKAG
jgi:hypothetical protein